MKGAPGADAVPRLPTDGDPLLPEAGFLRAAATSSDIRFHATFAIANKIVDPMVVWWLQADCGLRAMGYPPSFNPTPMLPYADATEGPCTGKQRLQLGPWHPRYTEGPLSATHNRFAYVSAEDLLSRSKSTESAGLALSMSMSMSGTAAQESGGGDWTKPPSSLNM